ncbi:MAG: DUF2165 family protein [Alphaproteobacteria bacterium]|nr:DUF2165 family protein [Alphaproteobacteria bacterium]
MLKITKIILALSVAAWGFTGAASNLSDWGGTTGAVAAATSMTMFEPIADSWRATTNPVVITLGAIFIVSLKIAGGALCLAGGVRMAAAIRAGPASFATAKRLAVAGCGLLMFMLFAGWIVIAETWFQLWRSDVWRDAALDSAFRYGAMITLIGIFIGAGDE